MPTHPKAWASWNVFRAKRSPDHAPVTLTYHMNRLQRLKTRTPYLVTLNPFRPIADEKIIAEMTYTHPIYTFESLGTQAELPTLNGVRHTYFCGSYFGYGFHEDAARSGVQVAAAMGGRHGF
jgi:predicted NAD/FAD-binding protein